MALFDTDVLIVGAGPTGLLLAGDLAVRGVPCMIVDREPQGSKLSRAFVVHARTLEQLDARGVAGELIETGTIFTTMRLFDRLDIDMSLLRSRFPFLLCTPQYNTERVLADRASRMGVEVLRGVEVVGLHQDADGVDVNMRIDRTVHTRRAKFVVGADGARSVVRDALGVPFLGRSAVESVMLADVRLRRPPTRELALEAGAEGFCFIAPFGDGRYRIIAWDRRRQLPSSAPVTLQEVSDIVRRVMGADLGLYDVRWLTRFHSDERQVPHYRVGRVFLAGDAAHVHSPVGGQGMNTGLQDAANLGWKLAAAVQGWAPDGTLDTYHAERHPVGRMVLRLSGRLLTTALARTRRARAARAALPIVNLFPPAAQRLRETMSGLAISYPAPAASHPLTGRRVPDVRLTGEAGRLYEALREGRFVLLAPAGEPAATETPLPAHVLHATPRSPRLPLMLVRPDGYVAWASTAEDPAVVSSLRSALTAWCGLPRSTSIRTARAQDSPRR
ncbi:FAD-dependent monooxygenase [Nonomuraea aridisoli]|uniref:FAD-dependent oxidoreductase n=1 Tax=Nonomuraea aridisoli TaxID=2070368 RepID=A0A2W2EEH2_9ACTN|nr:FAD-dependent monooxygenase [Nonomuraea aridisoli]PZG15269.1 FAD-dependent oxidoreductase [Nonomuraea aridisoli]